MGVTIQKLGVLGILVPVNRGALNEGFMVLRRGSGSIKHARIILALVALSGAVAYADDIPESVASNTEQAEARQFGIYFGGMASQYDLCVKKGLLPKRQSRR